MPLYTIGCWRMLEYFGPLRPIWCVQQKACDVHEPRSLKKWVCGHRKMQPHKNPVPAPQTHGLEPRSQWSRRWGKHSLYKLQTGNVTVKISFFTPTPKLTKQQFFAIQQSESMCLPKTSHWSCGLSTWSAPSSLSYPTSSPTLLPWICWAPATFVLLF